MAIVAFAPAYLVPMLANLVSIYVLTRILDPSRYGDYALVMSIMMLGQTGLLDWAVLGAKKFYERSVQSGKLPSLFSTIYVGLATSALAVVVLCWAGINLFHVTGHMATLLWLGAAVIIARELSGVSKSFELAAISRGRYMLMECGESLISVSVGIWLCWHYGLGASGLFTGMLVGALTIVAYDAANIRVRLTNGGFDLRQQKEILAFVAPLSAVFFVEYIMSAADRMMVQYFLGSAELGIYAVAYNIAERAGTAIFLALGLASYPLVVRAMERGGREGAMRQARQNVEVLMALALPAWAGFTVTSGHIATVLAGPDYAAPVAALLPLSGVAVFVYGLRVHYFAHSQHLTGKTFSLLLAGAPAALVNVVLNAILLPKLGLPGAVWARLISYLVALAINVWLCQRQFPMPFPFASIGKITLATLTMSGLLYVINFPETILGLAGMIVSGAVIYGVLALLFDLGGLRTELQLRRLRPAT